MLDPRMTTQEIAERGLHMCESIADVLQRAAEATQDDVVLFMCNNADYFAEQAVLCANTLINRRVSFECDYKAFVAFNNPYSLPTAEHCADYIIALRTWERSLQ